MVLVALVIKAYIQKGVWTCAFSQIPVWICASDLDLSSADPTAFRQTLQMGTTLEIQSPHSHELKFHL